MFLSGHVERVTEAQGAAKLGHVDDTIHEGSVLDVLLTNELVAVFPGPLALFVGELACTYLEGLDRKSVV